jgi:hypothetical protein
MADIGAVDLFRHRIMGELLDIGVAIPATHLTVQAVQKDVLVDGVILHLSVGIDAAERGVLMAHEAVFPVRRPGR